MQIANQNIFLLEHLSQDEKALRLFKQLSFLIHRNTYGGLTKNDLEALYLIKIKLARLLNEPEKEYITKLIDSFSIYDLPENLVDSSRGEQIKEQLYGYVSKQDYKELCLILDEHLSQKNSLYLKIKNHPSSLAMVDDLVRFAEENPPNKITELALEACNVWGKIAHAKDLERGYIHIILKNQDSQNPSFLCLKGLTIAQKYLNAIQPVEEVTENKPKRAGKKKPFKPNIAQGIVSLASRFMGSKLNSDIAVTDDMLKADKSIQKKAGKSNVKKIEGELVTDELQEELARKRKTTDMTGSGFFDIEQGFLFCIN